MHMNNKVLVIGADHHNTLGIVESLGQKGVKSYVLIVADIKTSFVLNNSSLKFEIMAKQLYVASQRVL